MIEQQTTSTSPTPSNPAPEEEQGMTLIEHLVELRTRLVRAAIGVVLGMGVGLFLVLGPFKLVEVIIDAFAPPAVAENARVQILNTTELFTSYMTVALTVGIILAMPVIVYQLLAFIVPGLTDRERRFVFSAIPFITIFFLAGVAFGWFVTVPAAIQFLLVGFVDTPLIQNIPSLADFLQIVTMLLLMNGIVFEMPVIIYTLAILGVVTAKQLAKYRRYAIVLVVIVAAIITPTGDPINLALLALPMYLLFELGVIFARFVPSDTKGCEHELSGRR